MQCRLYYYQRCTRFLQVTIRQLSSSNGDKTISSNSSDIRKAKWHQNGLNRPLLPDTTIFEKRNIFLM
jgi:hypothetical protein